MNIQRFNEKKHKTVGIILFTLTCILLITVVFLYKTFAIFHMDETQNMMNGRIEDPGDIYFAFYKDGHIQKDMPRKSDGYVLDENKSFCGSTGTNEDSVKVSVTEDEIIHVSGVTTSRTKCNLYFVKGIYILGKGIPLTNEGDGLYEVVHKNLAETINNEEFKKTEYRFAGENPNNYITFNDELWRMIGLVNVMTGEDIVEQRVKIIKSVPLHEFYSWDYKKSGQGSSVSEYGSNNWTDSQLMETLNGIYYNNQNGSCWKLDSNNSSKETICNFDSSIERGLKEVQNMIDQNITWNIGGSDQYNTLTVSMFYEKERGVENNNISYPIEWKKENTKNSNGNENKDLFHSVGLIYPSDYGYATNGGEIGRQTCIETHLSNWSTNDQCFENDWLKHKDAQLWTIFPVLSTRYHVLFISSQGSVEQGHPRTSYYVSPVLYLKTNVKIINNEYDGSKDKPYHLQQIL